MTMMMDEERREARSWLVGCSCAAAAVSIAAAVSMAAVICVEPLQFRVSEENKKRYNGTTALRE